MALTTGCFLRVLSIPLMLMGLGGIAALAEGDVGMATLLLTSGILGVLCLYWSGRPPGRRRRRTGRAR